MPEAPPLKGRRDCASLAALLYHGLRRKEVERRLTRFDFVTKSTGMTMR
jgi:hypothetical protein